MAHVWPTLLAVTVGHPLQNGACTPIAARSVLATPWLIGLSNTDNAAAALPGTAQWGQTRVPYRFVFSC